ncbi:hypothetical protein H5410_036087 [Solanum commersonii]|uniref:Uncharacterized protein n=1 Tax=Solanum commersonii TaxID=4109 RepID=A0A9J5Y4M8_SOLCO|nr:hypothetical protein H5410_036087 [Solanum commersonii]
MSRLHERASRSKWFYWNKCLALMFFSGKMQQDAAVPSDFLGDKGFVSFALNCSLFSVLAVESNRVVDCSFHGGLCLDICVEYCSTSGLLATYILCCHFFLLDGCVDYMVTILEVKIGRFIRLISSMVSLYPLGLFGSCTAIWIYCRGFNEEGCLVTSIIQLMRFQMLNFVCWVDGCMVKVEGIRLGGF